MEEKSIREMLIDEIKTLLENLKSLDPASEEYELVSERLSTLYKLKCEDDDRTNDFVKVTEAYKRTETERKQLDENKKDRILKASIALMELTAPLIFYGIWMDRGFKFEEEGRYTSQTFKGLFSRFRPTK